MGWESSSVRTYDRTMNRSSHPVAFFKNKRVERRTAIITVAIPQPTHMYMASAGWALTSSGGSEVLSGTVAMLCDSSSGDGLIVCARPEMNERTQSWLCFYCESEENCTTLAHERHSTHYVVDLGIRDDYCRGSSGNNRSRIPAPSGDHFINVTQDVFKRRKDENHSPSMRSCAVYQGLHEPKSKICYVRVPPRGQKNLHRLVGEDAVRRRSYILHDNSNPSRINFQFCFSQTAFILSKVH